MLIHHLHVSPRFRKELISALIGCLRFYGYPISDLSFNMFLSFQARNITVCIEFKNSDEEGAKPLKVSHNKRYIQRTMFLRTLLIKPRNRGYTNPEQLKSECCQASAYICSVVLFDPSCSWRFQLTVPFCSAGFLTGGGERQYYKT